MILKMSWRWIGTLKWRSLSVIIQNSLETKKTLKRIIKYFQLRCLNDGWSESGVLFLVMKSKTISTKEIWNTFTVSNENQNKISKTKTKELLSQIDRSTLVIFIAHLKFLFTISIRHNLNKIYTFIEPSV